MGEEKLDELKGSELLFPIWRKQSPTVAQWAEDLIIVSVRNAGSIPGLAQWDLMLSPKPITSELS